MPDNDRPGNDLFSPQGETSTAGLNTGSTATTSTGLGTDDRLGSTLGSDLTSGSVSGDALTGQRPIARDDYTTGDSTGGQSVSESTETTAR